MKFKRPTITEFLIGIAILVALLTVLAPGRRANHDISYSSMLGTEITVQP